MRKLFLLGLLLPLWFVSCSDEEEVVEVPMPKVTLTAGVATEHVLNFGVMTENAEACAYLCLEEGQPLPDAEKVLKEGVAVEANQQTDVRVENLKDGANYNIVAAAANAKYKVLSEVLKMQTVKELMPKVSAVGGDATENSLSFVLKSEDAEKGAYVCLKAGDELMGAEDVLANGVPFEVNKEVSIVVEGLEADASYSIVAAVAYKENLAMTDPLLMRTKEKSEVVLAFDTAEGELYSSFADVAFEDADKQYRLSMSFNANCAEVGYLPAGTYTLLGGKDLKDEFAVDIDAETTNLTVVAENKVLKLTEGEVAVTITDTKKYRFEFSLTADNGVKYVGSYEGKVKGIDLVYQLEAVEASYRQLNDQMDGEYYVYFHDADWNWELYIDFFADPASTELPAGKYVFGENKTPGSFGPQSNIQIYTPYTNNYLTGGEVTVTIEGDVYTIEMYLVGESGREMEGTFTGKIKG